MSLKNRIKKYEPVFAEFAWVQIDFGIEDVDIDQTCIFARALFDSVEQGGVVMQTEAVAEPVDHVHRHQGLSLFFGLVLVVAADLQGLYSVAFNQAFGIQTIQLPVPELRKILMT